MKTGPHASLASLLAATAFVSELLADPGEKPSAAKCPGDGMCIDPRCARHGTAPYNTPPPDAEFPASLPFTDEEQQRLERAIKLEATARCLRGQIRELIDELHEVETRSATALEGIAARRRRS
jgi:hypothetical protein